MDTLFIQGESSTSPQLSSSPKWNYDVFLSFRGEDTRKTFTGHLYSRLCQVGINTFMDDEELRKGEMISRELEKSIEESRVSIVVFSRNYASSSWCLDELVKILDCKDRLKQRVLPVFYDVDPSAVRKQTGYFGEALAGHKERFGAQRTEKWTLALTEAANLSGWYLQEFANGYEFKFIENIVHQVLQKVNQMPLDVAWYPVGVDTRVNDIELLLPNECGDEVHMVGIYGIGGIGKTTLAKAIYNQIFRLFDSSCFLSNVRSEAAEGSNGLVKLQEKLLHQILKTDDFKVNNVDEGIKLIEKILCSKRVLVILDDMDDMRQLQSLARDRRWFGSGSLIIITTRNKQLLCGLREDEKYEAKLLNGNEAMQLFSCHAFNSTFPPPQEYVKLAREIIKYSGGLPLALVTVGSHLQGRSIEEWRYEFQKLRAIPHSDIQTILKISFDGLDDDTQSVFLDIACAFHGFPVDEVTNTLHACGFHSESAIANLVRICLLQSARPFLEMHDLVRDMGRELVRRESPQEPGKRSRLFIPLEVRDVLQGNKGSERVEVLMVDPRALKGVNLSTKAFKKMKNLRVLKIDELHFSGKLELLSKDLRWLSWKKCPLKYIRSDFPAEKLVFLNLRGSNIQEFGLNMQCCKSLKELDLSDCKRLRRTPNFNGLQSLETLWLGGCSSLTEIHQSIGNLDKLIHLYLTGCKKLTDLPSSICQLKSLEFLDITCCSSIRTLPVDLGDMRSLKVLLALYTDIKQRVHRVRSLSTFVSCLILRCCDLSETDIPMDIGSLYCLEVLDLSGNSFDYLPFGFSKLRFLRLLGLDNCKNLQTVPSVSNLDSLKTFSLAHCKKLVKITEFDNLPSIERIDMHGCSSLKNPFSEGFFSAPALAFQSRKDLNRGFEICLQCNEIPDWCNNQVTTSYVCFTMPTRKEYKFLGIILWCVFNIDNLFFSGCWQDLDFDIVEEMDSCWEGLKFGIAGKMSSRFCWSYHQLICTGQAQLSCVFCRSYLDRPFDGQIKGGEKMELIEVGRKNVVEKIGIHLLYLDQQGKVTSLPAVMDHFIQMNTSQEIINGV